MSPTDPDGPAAILGPDGLLAHQLAGFAPRPQQQAMAQAVADALADAATLVCEAGTGTGKTFAYLVPALLSGKKVIVSTGSRNLQDQLFRKDLPMVRRALAVPATVALLKGRANYLCLYRLSQAETLGRRHDPAAQRHLARIRAWAAVTHGGDVGEIPDIPEHSPVWPWVTSTPDNCLGLDCPEIEHCHVYKARRLAQKADIVVVNHYLLCADLSLRDDGFGEILPSADAYVIDEAHQLPEVAAAFFGSSLTSRQLLDLAADTVAAQLSHAGDMPVIRQMAEGLEQAVYDLRLALGREGQRAPWPAVRAEPAVDTALDTLAMRLHALQELLEAIAERAKALESCAQRCALLAARLERLAGPEEGDEVYWFETFTRAFALKITPLDVAQSFQTRLPPGPAAWIYTSATLAVDGGFEHYTRLLGLAEPQTLLLDSPFDYQRNALLYLPEAMPNPNAPEFGRAVVEAVLPVFAASEGRAFFLFTSHRALRLAASRLEGRLAHPLLVQGTAPKAQLLEQFRALGHAVLLGTTSFWEGVDVRGEALSCVVIDRLPFAAPGDPVLAARIAALRERGEDPFVHFQLPWAVIMLKQGVGRLIRDVNDRGVLMICDPRLLTRSYGKVFRDSLPPLVLTRSIRDVQAFFRLPSADTGVPLTGHEAGELSGISYAGRGNSCVAQPPGGTDDGPRR